MSNQQPRLKPWVLHINEINFDQKLQKIVVIYLVAPLMANDKKVKALDTLNSPSLRITLKFSIHKAKLS